MRPALFHTRRVGMPVETQDAVDVVVFARDRGFREQRLKSLDDLIEFPTLGSVLPLSEIYYDIDFG